MQNSYSKPNWFISSPFVKTLVYGNVFIALCAFSQVLFAYHVFPVPVNFENNSYLLLVLLSTFLQYNIQRGYYVFNQTNINTDRAEWTLKHKKTLLYSIVISLITVLFLCNSLSYLSIGIMIGAELVSTLYYLQPFNLRRYGYVKPFLISFVWVISCSLVPLLENELFTLHSVWYLASQFVFISVLCMLFDVKEHEADYIAGVHTYANRFGVKVTKVICACLVIIGFTCFYQFNHSTPYVVLSLILRTLLLTTIFFTNDKRHAFYYYLWVDGLLILQTALFFIV